MSRFFATGSDSESDTSSEEEQVIRQPTANFTVRNFHIVHQGHTQRGEGVSGYTPAVHY